MGKRKKVVYTLRKQTLSTSSSSNPLTTSEYKDYETQFNYYYESAQYSELIDHSSKFLVYLNDLDLQKMSFEEYEEFFKVKFKWLLKFFQLGKERDCSELMLNAIESIIEYYQIRDNSDYSPDSLIYLMEYEEGAELSENPIYSVKANKYLGSFYLMKSQDPKDKQFQDLSKAKKYLQEARTQFRKILDERNHFKFNNFNLELFHEILINLGIVYFKSKQFTLAEDSFNLVIDMAKSNNDYENLKKGYANLSILYSTKKDYRKAIEYCELEFKIINEHELEGLEVALWVKLDLAIKSKNLELVQSTCRELSNQSLNQDEQEEIDTIVNQARQVQMFNRNFSDVFESEAESDDLELIESNTGSSEDISQMYLNKCAMSSITPNSSVLNWISSLFDKNADIQPNFSGQGWSCIDFSAFCSILEFPIPESSISNLNLSRNFIDDHCIKLIFESSKVLELIKSLDLSCTQISTKSLLTLLNSGGLLNSKSLEELNLSYLKIGNQSLLVIIKILVVFSKLRELRLNYTRINFDEFKFNDYINFQFNSTFINKEFKLELIGNKVSNPSNMIKWLNIINNFKPITRLNLSFIKCNSTSWTLFNLWKFITKCAHLKQIDISNIKFQSDWLIDEDYSNLEFECQQLNQLDLSHSNIKFQELSQLLKELSKKLMSRVSIYIVGYKYEDQLKELINSQALSNLNIIM
ncbi:hypothetical protein CONCODRAFT_14340 [Conidiobolus coronatus NRRL 28638]|uniref:Uncharacterized protein n=1 Tax=Conidiobolus coronatus (strain ATCC 28846 / CBS 209.66 / NRRL 28638) TaxID=796925 RepID=A0A137PJ75_CONC2|nr:hypothetical protein CONCODRAFT_14340 [Conidiobolus coronatus NRRL 28638]|eukprot:KXN74991.1 hypothetical protein CONCODRAFT_14340 [Conidiobolus coronatus NRRL 28638]